VIELYLDADLLGLFDWSLGFADCRIAGNQSVTLVIIYDLSVYVFVRLENRQAWALGCAMDLGSGSGLPSGEYCLFFLDSSHDGLLIMRLSYLASFG
jgi:hypothetical protein